MRPYSILEFLNKQRKENLNEKRLKEIEKKFKMKKNLVNKEDDKEFEENDNEFLISMSEDGEESFLNFVDNIHKKESMENEILIKDDEENNISNNNSDINLNRSYTKSLLEDDQSIISFYDDLSLDDINILPSEIGINKVFRSDFFQNENIKKNLDLNKLTQKIRSSFFDRQAVNTDINLTTKEQSKHFDDMNRRLQYQGMSLEQYLKFTGKTMDSYKKESEEPAKQSIKVRLVLEAIAKDAKIEVTEKEISEKVSELATAYGRKEDELMANEELKKNIEESIKYEKTINYIIDNAKVTEVSTKKEETEKKKTTKKATVKKSDEKEEVKEEKKETKKTTKK